MQSQLQTRLTELLMNVPQLVLPFYICFTFNLQKVLKVEGWHSSREFSNDSLCMCILILVCRTCSLLVVYLEGVQCICSVYLYIVYTQPLVALAFIVFALLISLTLMIFVLVFLFVVCP